MEDKQTCYQMMLKTLEELQKKIENVDKITYSVDTLNNLYNATMVNFTAYMTRQTELSNEMKVQKMNFAKAILYLITGTAIGFVTGNFNLLQKVFGG
jgi:Fe-S cluster biosynthesis and repair protein YggX